MRRRRRRSPRLTNSSIVVGAQRPVHQHLPAGGGTSEGADAVELARLAGLTLDDWQAWFLDHALTKRADGRWSAFEVGLIVPRQNGKGALLEARQLAGLFLLDDPLQVHSAHEFKTAFEHFLRIVNLVEGCPDLDRKVQRIRRGAGEQAIELKNGNRLRFLARSTGSGRGMTGDTIYLDEAFALTTPMMGALLPTLSAVPNPQVWYTSSAPLSSSEVLHSIRRRGRDGEASRLLFAEWGLDKDADPEDAANWYLANPAMGFRITEEFVRAELDAMRAMPAEFGRERLGIAELPSSDVSAIPGWPELADVDSVIESHRAIALDVSPDRKWASLAWAGRRSDGLVHVEAFDSQPGTAWVLPACRALWVKWRLPVRIQTGSPAASFVDLLAAEGVGVDEVAAADHARAVGQLLDAVDAKTLRHHDDPVLNVAVQGAELRSVGDVELWARRSTSTNVTPLVAVTLALGGVPVVAPSRGLFIAVT